MTRVYGSIVSTVRKKPSLTNAVISRLKEHYLDYLPHVSITGPGRNRPRI